jgi:hypothetical protein
MQRFIHQQNLARYIDLLESEGDPATRAQLQELLIEEVDGFGSLNERIDQVDVLIAQSGGRLRRQQALVAHRAGMGADIVQSEKLLGHMTQILQVMAQYRRTLLEGLDRSGL